MSLNGRLGNSEIGGVQGNPLTLRQPFANPSPTLCQPFANPSPTFYQPFANLFCQPLSNPLFPWTPGTRLDQVRKNSLNIKFWAGYSWDIRDPDVGISRTKTLCKWPFSVVLDREWPGCPGIWVGTSRIWKNFVQENFGLIFRTLLETLVNGFLV